MEGTEVEEYEPIVQESKEDEETQIASLQIDYDRTGEINKKLAKYKKVAME